MESLLSYPGDDIEIIVRDNHSVDATEEIMGRYRDPRISFRKNSENLGLVKNYLQIIEDASGDYVYVLTDDDYLLPGSVPVLKTFIEQYRPDAFITDKFCYLIKSKKLLLLSASTESKPPGCMTAAEWAHFMICATAFTSVCFRKSRLDLDVLKKQVGDNLYPSMVLCGLFGRQVAYLAVPTAVHTWENETFWGVAHDCRVVLNQHLYGALCSIRSFCDEPFFHELAKLFYRKGYVQEEVLFQFLPSEMATAYRRKILVDKKLKKLRAYYDRLEAFPRRVLAKVLRCLL